MDHYLNYIADQWCDAERALTIDNPASDQPCATVALADTRDADRAMAAARACVDSGALTQVRPAIRTEWLLKAAQAIRDITEQGARLCCMENGKRLQDARDEFSEAARYFEYYAGMADKLEGSAIPLGDEYLDFTQYLPFGVSVQIVPWNFPVSICARSLAPALAAGNAVVVKSPELSPLAMTLLIRAVVSAGFPPGAVQLLCGEGAEVGQHLATHPQVDQIVFTGSVATGQSILRNAAARATPSVMELGGKSAAVVLDDADIDVVLESVRNGIFFNSGQVCSALSRLLVQHSRYEEVKAAVVALAESLTIGPGDNQQSDITPLVSRQQQQRVLAMIDRAHAEGARLLTGGNAPELPGYFVAPTVIEAEPQMTIAQEEVFGPVLTLMPFDSEAQAIEIANGTPFGLVAGVFGQQMDCTLGVARQLRGGQVFVNEWFAGGIETPFGGVGLSGFGREKGQQAIYGYVHTRNIAIRLRTQPR
jgi:aldehyde dehydrogenase (NAD+)